MSRDIAMPHAPEAEVAVLGGMLIDNDAAAKVLDLLEPAAFYRAGHRRIYEAMRRLHQQGKAIDPVTLHDTMGDDLERAGGLPYIGELLDAVPTAANIEYHAGLVVDRWRQRRLIAAATEIAQQAYAPAGSVDDLVERATQAVMGCAGGATKVESHRSLLYGVFEALERHMEAGGGLTGLPTGFPDIDDATGGLQRGDLVIVAARPSMGKTAWATGAILHAAITQQVPVAFFSLEMSKRQVVQRMLCSEALVDLGAFLRGRVAEDDLNRLGHAASNLHAAAPILIDDRGALTVGELRAAARRMKAEHPALGLIVVDYLQLMAGGGEENRQQEVSAISRGLKVTAKELDVPLVALSQLSRAPEERADHTPRLSDLRESGAIEQDADVVGFLYRPEYYHGERDSSGRDLRGYAEFVIGKQRNGPTGTLPLYFRAYCARYETGTYPAAARSA